MKLSNIYYFTGDVEGFSGDYDLTQNLPVELGRERSGSHDVIAVKAVEFLIGQPGGATWRMAGSWMAMLHCRPNGDMVTPHQIFEDDVIWGTEEVAGSVDTLMPGTKYAVFHFPEPGFLVTQRLMFFSYTCDQLTSVPHFIGYNIYYVKRTISASQYARIACTQKPLL